MSDATTSKNEIVAKIPDSVVPTQVAFWDGEGQYCAGIFYHNEVICLCCGGVFEIDNIIAVAREDHRIPIIPLNWIDIQQAALGDMSNEELENEGLSSGYVKL